ncbi:SDR family oxidoreductase [Paractinoplanes durhamensis]|uniref:SDR family oxidoreductase n=1 Tax=Paractinoplanes durhamensis TaxID=113563 RepID=UPI00362CE922
MTVVVVTGGTRGIGQGLVRAFAAQGASVAFCGRTVAEVPEGTLGVTADVTNRADVRKLWDATVDRFGRVDIWVNNAGMSTGRAPLWQLPPDEIDQVVYLNLRGTLHASAVVLDAMLTQGHGALWNMEGLGSNGQIVPGLTAYGATKRALTYATLAMAKELKDTPVKVALLSPAWSSPTCSPTTTTRPSSRRRRRSSTSSPTGSRPSPRGSPPGCSPAPGTAGGWPG